MNKPTLISQRIATSRLVGQTILTEESLHGNAQQLNTSERKPVVLIEHDILCPPLGHTLSGEVNPTDDGYVALDVVSEIYGTPQPTDLPNGEKGFLVASSEHQNPLSIGIHNHHGDENVIRVDSVNFGGIEQASTFFKELRDDGYDSFTEGYSERRSELPDPQVIFDLGANASVLWIGYRIAKAAADALDPSLKAFFESMYGVIRRSATEMIPKNRPVTYVLNVHGDPNLQFVARTRDAEMAITAFGSETIANLKPIIETAAQRFNAEMVQFALSDDGDWELNYMVSKNGQTLGSERAFKLRTARISHLDGLPELTGDRAEP